MHFAGVRAQSATKGPNKKDPTNKNSNVVKGTDQNELLFLCYTACSLKSYKRFINFNSSTFKIYKLDFCNSRRVHEVKSY